MTVEQNEALRVLHFDGETDISFAAELKKLLEGRSLRKSQTRRLTQDSKLFRFRQARNWAASSRFHRKRMIDKFKKVFLEEAREVLVELEASLLALNENRSDKELVGRAFRALHTIKGSEAMFGFDRLAAFTHNGKRFRRGPQRATECRFRAR